MSQAEDGSHRHEPPQPEQASDPGCPESGQLSCRELVEFLDDYLEGRLNGSRLSVFEAHLHRCGHCVQYLTTYRETIHLCREAFTKPKLRAQAAEQEQPEPLPPALVNAIVRACREKR